ncbi:MAG: transcription elongation factor GreA [Chloroflexi bacterium]|nr:transcription elongation factor GreA [Chloroflexota bacterium]
MVNQDVKLEDAATLFLSSLKPEERQKSQQEVNRFIRWCGADRPISSISAREVESYAGSLGLTATNPQEILQPTKAFLAYARKQGLTTANLAPLVKLKKGGAQEERPAAERPQQIVHVTAEGYAELQTKLAELKKERPKIALELRHARADKDFRENAPLDAAREHQAQVEARIRELEAIVKTATVVDCQTENGGNSARVSLGSTVLLHDLTYDEDLRYTLVSSSEVKPAKGKISTAAPLGKALLNRCVGDVVEITAPAGVIKYKIEKIEE